MKPIVADMYGFPTLVGAQMRSAGLVMPSVELVRAAINAEVESRMPIHDIIFPI